MELPKKITPDNLQQAIVEIKFAATLPYELIIGSFFSSLDSSYKFAVGLGNNRLPAIPNVENPSQEVVVRLINEQIFFNDSIRLTIRNDSLIFSSLKEYIGWDRLKSEIITVLSSFLSTRYIDHFFRIGIRYISEYKTQKLTDIIKFSFSFGFPDIESDAYTFRSEFNWGEQKVILQLLSQVTLQPNGLPTNNQYKSSLVDIDVIWENFKEINLDILVQKLDLCHTKQKELFFTLLKEEFLNSLNPEY